MALLPELTPQSLSLSSPGGVSRYWLGCQAVSLQHLQIPTLAPPGAKLAATAITAQWASFSPGMP